MWPKTLTFHTNNLERKTLLCAISKNAKTLWIVEHKSIKTEKYLNNTNMNFITVKLWEKHVDLCEKRNLHDLGIFITRIDRFLNTEFFWDFMRKILKKNEDNVHEPGYFCGSRTQAIHKFEPLPSELSNFSIKIQ